MNTKVKKPGILKSLILLWKIMGRKERFAFIFLFLFSFISAVPYIFFNIIPALVLASACGQEVILLSINLSGLSTVALVFLLLGIHIILWIIGMLHYLSIDIFARKMICVVNAKAQDLILLERKNQDFNMTDGEVNYIVKNATDCVYQIIEPFCWNFFNCLIATVLNVIILFSIDYLVGIIGLAMIFLILIGIFVRLKIQNPIVDKIEDVNAKIGNHMLTTIQNISLITIMQSQQEEHHQLNLLNKIFFKYHKKRALTGFWYWIYIIFVEYSAIALAVYVFLTRAMDTQIVASLTMIFTILFDVQVTIESWGYEIADIQGAAIKLCNLESLNPSKESIVSASNIKSETLKNETIKTIEAIDYHVQVGKFKKIYQAKFESGKIYLLTGRSGCGKTTLINAICGLREVKNGMILINNKYSLSSLRPYTDKISYMFQNSILFDRTIEENISYPEGELNLESKKLIMKLSMKKLILQESERNNIRKSLSGGEKKRIDFIRAISKDADIYIFDEPTNELDQTNVNKVIKEIEKLKTKDKITIIISHDERILPIVDEVIVI